MSAPRYVVQPALLGGSDPWEVWDTLAIARVCSRQRRSSCVKVAALMNAKDVRQEAPDAAQ